MSSSCEVFLEFNLQDGLLNEAFLLDCVATTRFWILKIMHAVFSMERFHDVTNQNNYGLRQNYEIIKSLYQYQRFKKTVLVRVRHESKPCQGHFQLSGVIFILRGEIILQNLVHPGLVKEKFQSLIFAQNDRHIAHENTNTLKN